jgi:hypothetical protein
MRSIRAAAKPDEGRFSSLRGEDAEHPSRGNHHFFKSLSTMIPEMDHPRNLKKKFYAFLQNVIDFLNKIVVLKKVIFLFAKIK